MKLVALLIASSFIALSQVGVRVGRPQTVFIVEPVQSGNLSDDVARLSRESGGRDLDLDSLNLTTDGSRILFPPDGPVPRVDFETWVEGIAKQHAESVTSGFSPVEREPGKVAIERYVRDEFGHLYFRNRLVVEVLPGAETYRATFGDAGGTIPKQVPADWTTLTPPQYPVPQIVHDGDTIPLELYRGAATRRRAVALPGRRVGTSVTLS